MNLASSKPQPGQKGRAKSQPQPRARSAGEARKLRTLAARRQRAEEVYTRLGVRHPDARCALNHRNNFELLVATVLSAQCTDQRVNAVTGPLFANYADPAALASASPQRVEQLIHSLGFFRAKARAIVGIAQGLCDLYGGQVPATRDELMRLPGVGRKTANVVLGEAFGQPALTIDTHVGRLSRRLWLSEHTDPLQVEADLARLIPKETWTLFNHRMIFHGRRVCQARKPACGACILQDICPSAGLGPLDSQLAQALVRENAGIGASVLPATSAQ